MIHVLAIFSQYESDDFYLQRMKNFMSFDPKAEFKVEC